ncbi:MAG: hypothetical protein ACRDRH_16850 [Pseudonocardia sp.]
MPGVQERPGQCSAHRTESDHRDRLGAVSNLHRERGRLTSAIGELETALHTLDEVIATASPETERAAAALLPDRVAP